MYQSKVEKFLVGNNIDISVLNEATSKETHYVFIKISLFGKNTYALCALGEGYALEVIGEDESEAQSFFSTVIELAPSPCHIFDIISDFRRAI